VEAREIVCVLGANGAGKSTLMNTISRLLLPRAGRIALLGERLDGLPAHRTASRGIAHVLERRQLFPFLTVLDNVLLGAHNPRARPHRADEPFLGLAPHVVAEIGPRAPHPGRGGKSAWSSSSRTWSWPSAWPIAATSSNRAARSSGAVGRAAAVTRGEAHLPGRRRTVTEGTFRATTRLATARWVALLLALVVGPAVAGCATSFSPALVRQEIAAQTGQDPQRVFEMQLGRVAMRIIRSALGPGASTLPLGGLTGFELAFYDVPPPSARGAPLDFTRMAIRGWEPVVRTREPGRSVLILVREGQTTIDDLVLLGAGESTAIYVRLRGTLSPALPRALGDAFQTRGPEGLRDELVQEATRQR
jgi:hypothetical protein